MSQTAYLDDLLGTALADLPPVAPPAPAPKATRGKRIPVTPHNTSDAASLPAADIKPVPDRWHDARRGVPNTILRSALFGVSPVRKHVVDEPIAAHGGTQVFFTGELLDQNDLDVWAEVVHRSRLGFGASIKFSGAEMLKALGRDTVSGKSHKILEASLYRLTKGTLRITNGSLNFAGHLIDAYAWDSAKRVHVVRISPELCKLFESSLYTRLEWQIRQKIKGGLARWLHGFFSSHRDTPQGSYYHLSVDSLRLIARSSDAARRSFRDTLQKAMEEVEPATTWHLRIDARDCVQCDKSGKSRDKARTKSPLSNKAYRASKAEAKAAKALPAPARDPAARLTDGLTDYELEILASLGRHEEEILEAYDAASEVATTSQPQYAPQPTWAQLSALEQQLLAAAGLNAEDYAEILHCITSQDPDRAHDYFGVAHHASGKPLLIFPSGRVVQPGDLEHLTHADLGIDTDWPLPTVALCESIITPDHGIAQMGRLGDFIRRNAPALECLARTIKQRVDEGAPIIDLIKLFDQVGGGPIYTMAEEPACFGHLVEALVQRFDRMTSWCALTLLKKIQTYTAFVHVDASRRDSVATALTTAVLVGTDTDHASICDAADALIAAGVVADYDAILAIVTGSDAFDEYAQRRIASKLRDAVAI
jgi:hypothetical protein